MSDGAHSYNVWSKGGHGCRGEGDVVEEVLQTYVYRDFVEFTTPPPHYPSFGGNSATNAARRLGGGP